MGVSPLSPLLYFWRNARRALPVVLVVALAVFGVTTMAAVSGSITLGARTAYLEPLRYYAKLGAAESLVPFWRVRDLVGQPFVERVLPAAESTLKVPGLMFSEPRTVVGLLHTDLPWFLERTGLRLVDGRLPEPGKAEVAAHDLIFRGKHLHLGSGVGRDVDAEEGLRGRFTVVGRLDGPLVVAIAPLEAVRLVSPFYAVPGEEVYYAFPAPGGQERLERYLQDLPPREVTAFTLPEQTRRFQREIANMDIIIWILNAVTITVLSLAIGLLNTIYFLQQLPEFAILSAIGYQRGFLVRRALLESLSLTLAGWLGGLALSRAVHGALAASVFGPRGIMLAGIDLRTVAFTLPVPLMVGVFSLTTVLRALRRLDPVSLVERRA